MDDGIVRWRLWLVVVVMAAFGVGYALRGPPKMIHRTEAWLEDATPVEVDGYRALPGPNGDRQTYRMAEGTYEYLKPYGIISRVFQIGLSEIDTCVIASNTTDSMHEPMECFPGSGWQILESSKVPTPTKSRGAIPFTVLKARPPGGPVVFAAYCYKGPRSMVSTQLELVRQWKLDRFLGGEPGEGCFYRFIGDTGMTKEQLLGFAADYMDVVKRTSKGVL